MIGFRPKTSELYVERPRLLDLLPDTGGYVVWLEAPYGYGKSVLTSQWAEILEKEGWCVLWLSVQGRDLKDALASLLDLPSDLLWGTLLDALWREPTLLVLEDLEGDEDLNTLLKDVRGLLLIASRTTLPQQELPRLKTQKRLVHLGATQLAFTQDEARPLFHDPQDAELAWKQSQGWSLPLHFAALTGETPDSEALLEGMAESLSQAAWHEALLLSTLPYLPYASANEHSQELVKAGFVQELEAGLRLHPMTAEVMFREYFEACEILVQNNLHRLPPRLQAEACERVGLLEVLAQLLETNQFSHEDPATLLRWDVLAGGERGVQRSTGVGWSLWTLGREKEALTLLFETAARPNLSPDERLSIYKNMVWFLAQKHAFDEARKVEVLAEPYLEQATSEQAGRYLNNLFLLYFELGDWAQCETILQRALDVYPPNNPYRAIATGNLAITRWHHQGDIDGLLLERSKMLATNRTLNPNNVPGDMLQLAELHAFLGQTQKALELLSDVSSYYKANPRWTLEAEALKAYLEKNLAAFPKLLHESKTWQSLHELHERVLFFYARLLRQSSPGQALELLNVAELKESHWTQIERALALQADKAKALTQLGIAPSSNQFIELRLYWQAARFELTRTEEDLEALLHLTIAGQRLLPGLVALESLLKTRPELSKVYELQQVLQSTWKEAIELRHSEIPKLELLMLGRLEANVLGKTADLTDRHKAILALLALDYDRETIGEALWPETDTKKVLNNLNVQLNLLRKTLEPWGLKTYLMEEGLARTSTDIGQLKKALEQSDVNTVLRLYHEPLAPGVDLPLLDETRESLREEVIEVLFEAAQNTEEGVAYLERLLELDPLHEEALQLLLEKLVKRGRKREALKRYQSFASKLKTEMGLEPLEETRALLSS
jgi:DNA-binding SARP family transcriptional activator